MMSIATLAVEYMSKEKGGRGGILVNIAQNIDFRWTAQLPVYTATKYAIVGLSQSLAVSINKEMNFQYSRLNFQFKINQT